MISLFALLGFYCRLLLYLVDVKEREREWEESMNRRWAQRESFSMKKKKIGAVSAVVEANNHGVCSSLRD